MTGLAHDETVMATSEGLDLISHQKANVNLEPRCIWTYLLHDGKRVGIAYAGPSKFTVDAITETAGGAVGSSVSGLFKGIQVYIGATTIQNVSGPASDSAINDCGYTDAAAFLHAIDGIIEHRLKGGRRVQVAKHDDAILLGRTEGEKPVTLMIRPSRLVFTKGSTVFVEEDGRTVSVSESGVAFRNKDGRSLYLGGEGIVGLSELVGIGPMVDKAMRMMCGAGSLGASRRHDHMMGGSCCQGEDDESEDTS